ncbi:MAG: hypothetical protein K1X82_00225 [Bacteroidia bacterium]|nr:hypothetical protein [Bacteroidia bacterium]
MKLSLQPFIICLAIQLLACITPKAQTISAEGLKSDFQHLRQQLEKTHPGLYLYTSRERLDFVFDSLMNSFNQSLTDQQFYSTICVLQQEIKDGHTLFLPEIKESNVYLPFHFAFQNNQLYITRNDNKAITISTPALVKSINGVPTQQIIQEMRKRLSRDGNSFAYADWVIHTYFRMYYQFFFGSQPQFEVELETNKVPSKILCQGLSMQQISTIRQCGPEKQQEKGIEMNFWPKKGYAYLKIKDFHSSNYRSTYHQHFKKEVKQFFDSVRLQRLDNVILDLRDNQGGDIKNGVELLSYLMTTPFEMVCSYRKKNWGKTIGPQMGYHQPKKNAFRGQVIVLINGGSFSNSVIVSKAMKRANRATFIGSESGGNPYVFSGFAKTIVLPHSKIQVEIPTTVLVLDQKSMDQTSFTNDLLDYPCLQDVQTPVSDLDPCMEKAIQLAKEKTK